jgi:hypothetical protein
MWRPNSRRGGRALQLKGFADPIPAHRLARVAGEFRGVAPSVRSRPRSCPETSDRLLRPIVFALLGAPAPQFGPHGRSPSRLWSSSTLFGGRGHHSALGARLVAGSHIPGLTLGCLGFCPRQPSTRLGPPAASSPARSDRKFLPRDRLRAARVFLVLRCRRHCSLRVSSSRYNAASVPYDAPPLAVVGGRGAFGAAPSRRILWGYSAAAIDLG